MAPKMPNSFETRLQVSVGRFPFTDGNPLSIQQVNSSQNDRIWSVDSPSTSAIINHHQYPKSVLVWSGI
ncbi:hypothetical protein TNCV_2892821 [Trichonephila clavipes]|nr:hypothetical protein TNCV_2892821 [Trichonephila clavipes]